MPHGEFNPYRFRELVGEWEALGADVDLLTAAVIPHGDSCYCGSCATLASLEQIWAFGEMAETPVVDTAPLQPPKWTKEEQDRTKFLSLFYLPGLVFMECVRLQSTLAKFLVLGNNRDRIEEYKAYQWDTKHLRWYWDDLLSYMRKSDFAPVVKEFCRVFDSSIPAQVKKDLEGLCVARNALAHCYMDTGQHVEVENGKVARLFYIPRKEEKYALEITADEEWFVQFMQIILRVTECLEIIAEGLGISRAAAY